jgi:DNA invertase Pin-like site-specific DNA recombinase
MEPKIYGYARVSTVGQAKDGNSLEAQESALRAAGATEIFVDTFTGTKMERPEFDRLNSLLQKGDTLIITKLDRFARTVGQASELITDLIDRGITVNVLNLGVLDNSSISVLMRNILLSFAQFERDMIVQRTQEGRAIARTKEGYQEGRPKKYTGAQLRHAMELLKDHSYTQVARMTGISKSTLIREKKKYEGKQA